MSISVPDHPPTDAAANGAHPTIGQAVSPSGGGMVGDGQLPQPPVPAECDLRGYEYMPLYGNSLFGSSLNAHATDTEWRVALTLWWAAWTQVPAASLPDDERTLCMLAGLGRDLATWRSVKPVAMRGFTLCADGRLYHSFLASAAMIAWGKREKARQKKSWQRVKARSRPASSPQPVPTPVPGTSPGQHGGQNRDRPGTSPAVEPGQGRDVPQQEKGKEGKGIELKGGEGIKDSIATSPPDADQPTIPPKQEEPPQKPQTPSTPSQDAPKAQIVDPGPATPSPQGQREQDPFRDDNGQPIPPPAPTPSPRPKGPREDDEGDPEALWHAGIKGRTWARSLIKTGAPIGPGNWLTWWGLLEHCCEATVEETNHAALVDFVSANFAGKGKKPWPDEVRAKWDEEQARGPITSLD
jgi:hypothetical protein